MKEENAERTREEINRKISDLRNTSPDYAFIDLSFDWHSDANWPTLLREAGIYVGPASSGIGWSACLRKDGEFTRFVLAEDVAEAVCLTWLKWKELQ